MIFWSESQFSLIDMAEKMMINDISYFEVLCHLEMVAKMGGGGVYVGSVGISQICRDSTLSVQ